MPRPAERSATPSGRGGREPLPAAVVAHCSFAVARYGRGDRQRAEQLIPLSCDIVSTVGVLGFAPDNCGLQLQRTIEGPASAKCRPGPPLAWEIGSQHRDEGVPLGNRPGQHRSGCHRPPAPTSPFRKGRGSDLASRVVRDGGASSTRIDSGSGQQAAGSGRRVAGSG